MFIILDFGSQYTHLIQLTLFKLGIKSDIVPGDETVRQVFTNQFQEDLRGIIFSGGAASVYDGQINFDHQWLKLGVPILGICYGHQLLANTSGGLVKQGKAEFGTANLRVIKSSKLFADIPGKFIVWMSHHDSVNKLPPGFVPVASSDYSEIASFCNQDKKFYGVQFHPEVSHTEYGDKILENFCSKICGARKSKKWNPTVFITETVGKMRQEIGTHKMIFGLSGGVDSFTMAALLREALPKKQLKAVYVDTGLMPDETEGEVIEFCQKYDLPLKILKSQDVFFKALRGIDQPAQKGKVIGESFIRVFEKYAKEFGADYFAQGTIWSDVVESGVTKFSSQIKPHHNVGGLPEKMAFKLVEPLRKLFKNQVREVAKELGLPKWVVARKVFPGPGFAIRIQGEATPQKVELVRKATKIVEDQIYRSAVGNKIWMAFSILVNAPSLGVKGDKHVANKHAIVVRIVESENSMTANFSRIAMPYLPEISRRITAELGIGRVVYDITDKPPATIEWQ